MTQHPIDLLPEFVRIKCQHGVRTGRHITFVIAAVIVVVIATTHTRFELDRSRERLARAEDQANIVIQLEERAAQLTHALDEAGALIELHELLSFPFEASSLLATIINQLPESLTIEGLDIDASPRRAVRGQIPQKEGEEPPRRLSAGELNGFAASDDDIGELVARMQSSRIFQSVTWDYSRSRVVRERPARAFRVSFHIDLDEAYEVVPDDADWPAAHGDAGERRDPKNAAGKPPQALTARAGELREGSM